jgi:phytoene desaturase
LPATAPLPRWSSAAGFGGLAAAVRLACRGWRVKVLEKLDAPGGRAYVFREGGFTFDAGPTIVTVPHLFDELWALAGRRLADDVTLRSIDPFYRIRFDDGTHFDYCGDAARMRAEVARISPDRPGRATSASWSRPKRCYQLGFVELGAPRSSRFGDLLARCAALVQDARVAQHLADGRAGTCATRSCAWCSASIRC